MKKTKPQANPLEKLLAWLKPWMISPSPLAFGVQFVKVTAEVPPWKFNSSPLNIYHLKRKVVFQPSFFRGYVKLWEGMDKINREDVAFLEFNLGCFY